MEYHADVGSRHVCVRVRGRLLAPGCEWVCACVRASVCFLHMCPCTRAFVSAHVGVFSHFHLIASSRACVFHVGVFDAFVPRSAVRVLSWHGGDRRYLQRCPPRVRACVCAISRVSRALAAGVTWTNRSSNAQWAARFGHTSVIDAAGAIYVLGGFGGDSVGYYADVWKSTDGGA